MEPVPITFYPSKTLPERTVEGTAKVVAVEGSLVWLEPEQTASCGSCAAGAACGTAPQAPGIGTVTNRIAARRFSMRITPDQALLRVGDRVVIGVDNRALIKGSLLAYALPLGAALSAGGFAQGTWESDGMTILATGLGLALGFLAARLGAGLLNARGELSPRFLRRAAPGETCGTV